MKKIPRLITLLHSDIYLNVETKISTTEILQKTCLPPFAAVRYHNPTGIGIDYQVLT